MSTKRKEIKTEWLPAIIEFYEGKKLNPRITNQNVADDLNEMFKCNFNESAWRKHYQTAMKGFDLMKKELSNNNITEEELDRKVKVIAKARTNNMLELKINTEMRKELHYDMRIAAKYSIIDQALLSVADYKFKEINFSKIKTIDKKKNIPVYAFGDIHYGLLISIKNNEYSPEIAQRRMNQVADFIVDDIKLHGYNEIILFEGGDLIEGSGNLRASQWLSTVMTMTQQISKAADFMTSFYLYLNNRLADLKNTVKAHAYMISASNHTQLRMGNTKRDEIENDDVSILIADIIRKNIIYAGESIYTERLPESVDKFDDELTADDYKVNFTYADEHIIDINGTIAFLTHGHQYKYAANLHNHLANNENIIVDVVYSAHYHSFAEDTVGSRGKMNKKKIFMPSICGDTSYAHRLGYSSMPGAIKSIYSGEYGNIGNIFIPVD